ncbi:MAG: CHAT domain-containing protein [Sphingobacteriaceae bacterium]
MKMLLLIVWICMSVTTVMAQESDYEKSVRMYRENKLDSAQLTIQRAIKVYLTQHKADSLVFAYVQKALVDWDLHGIKAAFTVIDSAIHLTGHLTPKSIARVAAYSRLGQLYAQQFELKQAARNFDIAEKAVDSKQPANRHYVILFNQIAIMHLMAEQYPNAKKYAEKAYALNIKYEGKDGSLMPNVVQARFFISHYSDDLQQALKDGVEFERVIKLHYPPGHRIFGVMHNSLAIVYETLLRYEEALFHRQLAVEVQLKNYQKNKNPFSLGSAYHNLGLLYGYIHEGYLSAAYLEKGSKLLALNYGEKGAGMINILVDLAVNKQQAGAHKTAENLFKQAYSLQLEHDPENWASIAYIESFYGDFYRDRQQYHTAADLYQKSIAHYKKAGLQESKTALLTQEALAKTFSEGGKFEKAITIQKRVLAALRAIYPSGNDAIAGILQGMSESNLKAGKLEDALAYSNQVFLELLQIKALPVEVYKWFSRIPFSYHTSVYIRHRVEVLQTLYRKTGKSGFLIELLSITDEYSAFISDNLHFFRTQAPLAELAEVNKDIYSIAMEASWTLSDDGKHHKMLERAFGYSERSKAMLLKLVANNMLVDAQHADKDPVAFRDRDFRRQLSSINLQYLQAGHKDSLLTLLTAKMEQYRLFMDSLKRSGNSIISAKQDLVPAGLKVIREKLLQQKRTLIEYAVTDQSLFTFLLSADTFLVKRASKKVLQDISSLKDLHGLNPDEFAMPAYRLYQALIEPIEPYFNSSRLLIIPDADLYQLNYELLLTDSRERDFAKMHYLIRKYDISYLLSAASAIQFKNAKYTSRRNSALLFVPVFTDRMKSINRKGLPEPVENDNTYRYLYRQPFALQAAIQIGDYVAGDLFTEQKASERAFKAAAPEYRILHLGTHAEANDQAPLQSRLFFARALPGDTLNTDDGFLYAYEIYAMRLKADLAVLTACETGQGVFRQGEGVISLAHSFMYAGCPSVIMSLWKIDDKTSAGIITAFYRLLSLGKSKSEALRSAKLLYLNDASQSLTHPYYWAGLALIGDDAPIYPQPYRWVWGYVGFTLLSGLGYWGYRRFRRS